MPLLLFFVCVVVISCSLFYSGSCYAAQISLELRTPPQLLSAGVISMRYHTWLNKDFVILKTFFKSNLQTRYSHTAQAGLRTEVPGVISAMKFSIERK